MSRRLRLVLIISILASFIAFLDSSVVNVALMGLIIGTEAFSGSVSNGVTAFIKSCVALTILLFSGGLISGFGIVNSKT